MNLKTRRTKNVFLCSCHYCKQDEIVNTKFLGIVQLTNLSSAEIMDVLKKFLTAKYIDLSKILFSVLDGTNSLSGKQGFTTTDSK